jgi:hypothetical protein
VSPTPRSPAMHEPRERNHALLRFCAATMMEPEPDHFALWSLSLLPVAVYRTS